MFVAIDPNVTEQQRTDPRFKYLHQHTEEFFSDPRNDTYKLLLGLHESGHSYFARKAGATNIHFRGPTMTWDSRPQYDCPAISKAATFYVLPPDCSVLDHIKSSIAGFICRREMSGTPNDEIAIGMDIESCREWFYDNVTEDEAVFNEALLDAERSLLVDLRSPQTRHELWDEARRIVSILFPCEPTTNRTNQAAICGAIVDASEAPKLEYDSRR